MSSCSTLIRVSIPGRVGGEIGLAPITVIMGAPRSGKTTLLRLTFDTLYYAQKTEPLDLEPLQTINLERNGEHELLSLRRRCGEREEVLSLRCGRDGCSIDLGGYADRAQPLLVPSDADAIARFGYVPPLEHYAEYTALLNKLRMDASGRPRCLGGYEAVLENLAEPRIVSRSGELYEVADDREVPLRFAATATVKLGVLEEALRRGLLDDYTHLLLDNPETGLHPLGQAKLALMLHALANCGKTIIVATHDVVFLDMLTNVHNIARLLSKLHGVDARVEPVDVAIYAIEDGRLRRYEPTASFIRDYTPYIYAAFGYLPEEIEQDYARFRKE